MPHTKKLYYQSPKGFGIYELEDLDAQYRLVINHAYTTHDLQVKGETDDASKTWLQVTAQDATHHYTFELSLPHDADTKHIQVTHPNNAQMLIVIAKK